MLADARTFVDDQDTDYIGEYSYFDGGLGHMEERSYRVYDVQDYLVETHQLNSAVGV